MLTEYKKSRMKQNTQTTKINQGLSGRATCGDKPANVKCQICGEITVPGVDLGNQPVGDLVLTRRQLNQPETFYPLKLQHCLNCGLTQLSYIVNPKVVYKNFPFVSGTTQTATHHLQSLPKQLVKMVGLDEKSFAVDIGSNDGTLLKGYIPDGVKFLGVDPSGDPVRIANEQGIETLHTFFNVETADYIAENYGEADALTACGVFGHIADLAGVMNGAKKLLAKRGVFATDSQYWLDTMQRLHYDNMFHQHLRYYSMKRAKSRCENANFLMKSMRSIQKEKKSSASAHRQRLRQFAIIVGSDPTWWITSRKSIRFASAHICRVCIFRL